MDSPIAVPVQLPSPHDRPQPLPHDPLPAKPDLPNGADLAHLLKDGLPARGVMKNGRLRPSAVRDYPEEIGLRKSRVDPEVGKDKVLESVTWKDSGQEQRTVMKAANAPHSARKEASLKNSGASRQSKLSRAEEKPMKLPKERKPKKGNFDHPGDGESSKPEKPQGSRGQRVAARDSAGALIQNGDQKLDVRKPDEPEVVEASYSQPLIDEGGPVVEGSEAKESSRVDSDNGKKLEKPKQETLSARKNSKATQPSSTVKPPRKSRKRTQDETDSQDPTQESTPKKVRQKSATPKETIKKGRRSAGKTSKPTSTVTDLRDPRKVIVETLRIYDALRRKVLQDEEKYGKQGKGRADLQAGALMKEMGLSLNRNDKVKGPVPGVEVGDLFCFRMEISCIGMHGPIQGGIDYLNAKETEWNVPLAISIISILGQDSDSDDTGETLVYSGQGGKSADSKQTDDQKLERGNLAMDGSKIHNVPVRVIRGIKDPNCPAGKIYTYDGLYMVQETKTVKGTSGFDEYRFMLQRVPGQPQLGSHWLKEASKLKNTKPSLREDVVIEDISQGKENQPICVVNAVDDEQSPVAFEYSTKVEYSNDIDKPVGCNCKGPCGTSNVCACFSKNGDEFAYLNSGILVKEKDIIFECGSHCTCSSSCRNRLTERGLKFQLEVFKTNDRGWGVRSLEVIPAGGFVCEYTGKMIVDLETDCNVSDREHVLDLRRLPDNMPRWGDVSGVPTENPPMDTMPEVVKPKFILDASHIGNVARFLNHSCSPNLLAQKVLSCHQDVRLPQIKLFAMDNIPPFKELTFDYGCPISGTDEESKDCLCGSTDCKGKLYY